MNKPSRMTADEFLAWAVDQPGRFELHRGQVVAMAPERVRHNLTKTRITRHLAEGVDRAGLRCQVFGDGMTVRIDESTIYEPDTMVRCGPDLPGDAIEVTDPVIVVEVLSPSSRSVDSHIKLDDYFRLASVMHYLVVNAETGTVVHYRRDARPEVLRGGEITLDPPGLRLALT